MSRKPESDYDVIVAGGGAGGIGAALGAARCGARVLLLEKYGFLGGAATSSQVLAYCGFFQQGSEPVPAVAGAGALVLDELKRLGLDASPFLSETTGNWIIRLDPEAVKLALDRVLTEHGVDVLLHTRVAAATRTADMIESVTAAGMEGRWRIGAEAFVDATGDANLSLVAGVDCRVGNDHGHLQAASAPIRIGGLQGDVVFDRGAIRAALDRYNASGGAHPVRRDDGGIYTRVPGSNDMWWLVIDIPMADLTSASYTRAEQVAREAAHDYVKALRGHVPGFDGAYLIATGPQIGIRESRHPEARCALTREDLSTGRRRSDGVARAAWPMEDHSTAGRPAYFEIGGSGYAHVPLDALRARRIDNLWFAGRVVGADPMAYASIRVMGTSFATGEAAGVAAALRTGDAMPVRTALMQHGALV
jgi:hypothetical protein